MSCLTRACFSSLAKGKGLPSSGISGLFQALGKYALPAAAINIYLISRQRFFRQGWDRFFVRLEEEKSPFWRLVFGGVTVALGLSQAFPFGLSLKAIDRPPAPGLLPSWLSPREFKQMLCQGLLADTQTLWALCSAKEAFLNFLGYKFALPPSRLEIVSLDPFVVRRSDGREEEFFLKQIKLCLGGRSYLLSMVRLPKPHPRPLFGIKIWPTLKETCAN